MGGHVRKVASSDRRRATGCWAYSRPRNIIRGRNKPAKIIIEKDNRVCGVPGIYLSPLLLLTNVVLTTLDTLEGDTIHILILLMS